MNVLKKNLIGTLHWTLDNWNLLKVPSYLPPEGDVPDALDVPHLEVLLGRHVGLLLQAVHNPGHVHHAADLMSNMNLQM